MDCPTKIDSPNTKLFESPIVIVLILSSEILALTTAISDHLSLPMTLPSTDLLLLYVTFCFLCHLQHVHSLKYK